MTSYQYNGLGDRLTETVNGVTTTFTMDLNTGLTQALSDGARDYLYGAGRIAQLDTATLETEYFLGDALGSVRQLTDATGAVTFAQTYDPYGKVNTTSGAGSSGYGFTGEYQQDDLVYLRARMYAPDMGRFLQRDPSRLESNLYAYAKLNPVNRRDPSGLYSEHQIYKQIPEHQFDCDPRATDCPRTRWGFHALLLAAQDWDAISMGYVDLWTDLYPRITHSVRGHRFWTYQCDKIMVGSMRLEDFYSQVVKRNNNPQIFWRDTSVSYYQLDYNSVYIDSFPSHNGIQDITELPHFRGLGISLWLVGAELIYNVDGDAYIVFSTGYGGSVGSSYLEGYTTSSPPSDFSGLCGSIAGQIFGGISLDFCTDFKANLSMMTTYKMGLEGGGAVPGGSITLPLSVISTYIRDTLGLPSILFAPEDPKRGWRRFLDQGLNGNTKHKTQPIY